MPLGELIGQLLAEFMLEEPSIGKLAFVEEATELVQDLRKGWRTLTNLKGDVV